MKLICIPVLPTAQAHLQNKARVIATNDFGWRLSCGAAAAILIVRGHVCVRRGVATDHNQNASLILGSVFPKSVMHGECTVRIDLFSRED